MHAKHAFIKKLMFFSLGTAQPRSGVFTLNISILNSAWFSTSGSYLSCYMKANKKFSPQMPSCFQVFQSSLREIFCHIYQMSSLRYFPVYQYSATASGLYPFRMIGTFIWKALITQSLFDFICCTFKDY